MATLRPHKQLSLLLLAGTSPWIPRAPSTLSGGNSLRTPSFCRALPRHPTPYPPRGWAPRIPAPRPRAGIGASRGRGPRAGRSLREPHSRPAPYLPLLLLGVVGSPDTAPGAGAKAGSGLRLGNRVPGVSCPLLWAASGTSSRFCCLSLSPDPECRLRCPRAGPTLRCHLSLRSAEPAAPQRSQTHQGG